MKPVNKKQFTLVLVYIIGTILLAGIILAVDFLFAGVQERFISNIDPEYIPHLVLANKAIIGSTISLVLGLAIYILVIWFFTRTEKIEQQIKDDQIIDTNGSLNFKSLQFEISQGMKLLRDLFLYLITIIVIAGLFLFLRFVWVFSKYGLYDQFVILYFLTNTASMIISITLYLALALMVNYVIITSLQKYRRLQLISRSYDQAMNKVIENYDRLVSEESESESN
ncbi:MAG: hypothetical protein FK733_16840 [Asgard group archaeon]|nr:hypothetical protein [Asgard group archaeon]